MDNRVGLAVGTCVAQATSGTGSGHPAGGRDPCAGRVTLGVDKGYDRKQFIQERRDRLVTPHIACKANSTIDARTTGNPGYALSQHQRKRIEEILGLAQDRRGLRKARHRGVARGEWMFTFALAAYNLVRMRNLLPAPLESEEELYAA